MKLYVRWVLAGFWGIAKILCWFCLILVAVHCKVKTLILVLQEDADTRLAIQEALSMMVGAYTNLEGAQRTLMEVLVASYLIKVFSIESKLSNLKKKTNKLY